MIKKLTPLSIVALLMLFIACKKVDNIDKRPFSYTIDGFKNISIPANYISQLRLDARLLTGDPTDKLFSLTIDGLPPYISVDSIVTRFRLNYQPTITFSAHDAAQGTYLIRCATRINNELQRTDSFYLTVGPPINLTGWLCKAYYYDVQSACGGGIYAKIDSMPPVINRIKLSIENLMNMGQLPNDFIDTYADVNATDSTFIIPLQEVRGDSIQGKGYYHTSSNGYRINMHVDDTLVSGGQIINTCSLDLTYTH